MHRIDEEVRSVKCVLRFGADVILGQLSLNNLPLT